MNIKSLIWIILFFSLCPMLSVSAQQVEHTHDVYNIDLAKDAVLLGAAVTVTVLGDILLRNADKPNLAEIASLDRSNLWSIDRGATDNFSKSAETTSDIILFSAAALPLTLYAFDKTKGNEMEVVMMTAETFLITNGVTNIVKAWAQRYRPFNYNPDVSDEFKLGSTSRQSFFSGHASNTAAFCFLTSSVLNDMHPHWGKGKKVLSWTLAASIPLAISYGRYKAGKHFVTDVLSGYLFGAGIGLLIPKLHKSDHQKVIIAPGAISYQLSF